MYLIYFSEHSTSHKKSVRYSQFLWLKRIHSGPQYLLEAQIHMYLLFIWREYPVILYYEPGWKLMSSQGNNCWHQKRTKIRIYHLCLSQHTVGPIPTSRNSLPNIGLTWADQVPQENLGERTSWLLSGGHLPLKTCW